MNHETLILAAIAIGKQYPFIQKDQGGRVWEPHLNDGDALRLAVKLGLFVRKVVREIPRSEYDDDPYAATRRAIVRAAAAIGGSMFTANRQTEDGCPIDPQQSVIALFNDGMFDCGLPAGAWHESWNTSRQIHIKAYWIINDE